MAIKYQLLLLLIFFVLAASAQKNISKGSFIVNAQLSLLNGDDNTNGQVTVISGYDFHNWMIGAGTGFDYYKYRTVPVFADVRRYFGTGGRRFFIYGNMGLDVPWPTSNQKISNGWWGKESRFKNGIYSDAGFGYTLFSNKNRGFFAAAGYSTKMLTEIYNETIWNGSTIIQTTRSLEYTLNRFLFRLGYKF